MQTMLACLIVAYWLSVHHLPNFQLCHTISAKDQEVKLQHCKPCWLASSSLAVIRKSNHNNVNDVGLPHHCFLVVHGAPAKLILLSHNISSGSGSRSTTMQTMFACLIIPYCKHVRKSNHNNAHCVGLPQQLVAPAHQHALHPRSPAKHTVLSHNII
jgi:hypothetical protein